MIHEARVLVKVSRSAWAMGESMYQRVGCAEWSVALSLSSPAHAVRGLHPQRITSSDCLDRGVAREDFLGLLGQGREPGFGGVKAYALLLDV